MPKPAQLPISWPRRSRSTDPLSSHEAAYGVTESGAAERQKRLALTLVDRWPGSTSRELACKWAQVMDLDWRDLRYMLARRLPELREEDLVENREGSEAAERPCEYAGRRALRWWPTWRGKFEVAA